MSSPSRTASRLLVSAALSLALAGCLQPLYGPGVAGGGVAEKLAEIKIMPIGDRVGHYLENELRFAFNGSGEPKSPRYTLYIGLRQGNQSPLVDTVTGYPSSATQVVGADYTLIAAGETEPVAKGTVNAQSSYDRFSQRYANVRAARDADIRNARLLAEQIKTNIAAAFAQKG